MSGGAPLPQTIHSTGGLPKVAWAKGSYLYDATGKQYRYFVWNHPTMNPLLRQQAWHVPAPLDLAALRAAARLFPGRHDFKSFAATRHYEQDTTIPGLCFGPSWPSSDAL